MVTFSVVIPTRDRPNLVRTALRSVLEQTLDDFEVIIVDDGSVEPLEAPTEPGVRLIRSVTSLGPAGARNLGAGLANGEVLAFLDDDDTWTPGRLSFAAAALERAPVATCWQTSSGGRVLEGNVHDEILDTTTPSLGATAILKSEWVEMDESYASCEDLAWWLDVTSDLEVATHQVQGLRVRRHDGPRPAHGLEQRIEDSRRMLTERSTYFGSHPRARAFRWKRIGVMATRCGDYKLARRAFLTALRLRPNLADIGHLARLAVGLGGGRHD